MFEKYAALFGLMVSLSLVFLLAMYDLGERINKSRLYAKYIRLVIIALATLVGCLLLNYVFIASCR